MRRKLTKSWMRWLGGGALLSVLAVPLAMGVERAGSGDASHPPRTPLTVAVAAVERVGSHAVMRTYTGTVRARRTAELGFERGGRLLTMAVDVGDAIRAGDELARLDASALLAERDELAARRSAAVALLRELESGPRVEVIDAARAEVQSLEAERDLALLQRERRADLVERRIDSQAELDLEDTGLRTATARLDGARARLAELESGTRNEQLDAQRARVRELDASLARIEVEIERTRIIAPFDATVAARTVDEGTVVEVGQTVLRVVETGHLEAWIGVSDAVADELSGSGAALAIEVAGRELAGRLARVLPEVDPGTRTATLVVEFEDHAEPRARPGQIARLVLRRSVASEGFRVPVEALTESARGLWSCYVVEPGDDAMARVARAEVEVLHVDGDHALVRGTLSPGDLIVARGAHRVVPGEIVRPRSADQ